MTALRFSRLARVSFLFLVLTGLGACDSSSSVINPVASAGADQTVGAGASVTLNGSGSTGSGALSYSWTQTAGTAVTLSSATTAMPTFTAPAVTADEVLTFQLTVADQNNLTSVDSVNITVIDGIPTADAGPDQAVIEGAAVTLDGSGSTQTNGGTIVSYAWVQTGGPAVLNLAGADTTSPTFDAPSVAMDEVINFELTVTDDNGDTDTDTVAITVRDDTPPVADAGPDQTVDEGTDPVTLDGSGSSDAVGSIASYSWSQTAGTPVVLTGGDTASPTFAAPQVGPAGETLTFELTVTDDAAQSDTDTVDIVVNNVNASPSADAGPDQSIAEGTSVNLDGTGSSDPDGSIAAYAWTQTAGPAVTLNNDATATPDFTAPLVVAQATLTFALTVTDDVGAEDTDTVDIVINSFNVPPTADAGPDQTVAELTPVNLDGTGSSDPDGAIAAYAWTQTAGPSVTLLNGNTATPNFTTPDVTTAEVLTFQLTVTDDNPLNPKQDTDTVDITVEPPNTPPSANAGPDQSINEQSTVNLDGTGSTDSDGTVASYQWTQTGGTAVTLTNSDTAIATFTAPAGPATLTFDLEVTDNDGATNTDTTTVTVNALPTANAGPDQSVDEQSAVSLDASASSDVDGTITGYAWTQTAGTAVVLNNANTATPDFTAPSVGLAGESLTFEVEITDDDGATDTDSVDIQVDNDPALNILPTAVAGPDQTVGEGVSVTLDGSGSSDDTLITDYQWTQTAGTAVTLTNADQAIASFTSPAGPATLTFELEVTDEEGGTATDQIDVNVSGTVTVSGAVTFDFIPLAGLGFGGLDYGNITQRPARLVTIEVIDAGDDTTVIATDTTDSSGNYSFTLDPNLDVFLRVRAEMVEPGPGPSWNFRIVDNTNSDAQYVLDTVDINTGTANQTVDINAETAFDGNDYTVRNGAVFAILDTVYGTLQAILAADPTIDFVPLDIHWSVNNTTVFGDVSLGEIGTSFYRGGNPIDGVYLLGDEDVDTEEYDKHVITHELGHYIEGTLARNDSIGGSHTLTEALDIRLAYSESWANTLSAIATADTTYIDTLSTNQSLAGGFDIEDGTIFNGPNLDPGWFNERSVQELFYDLYDSNNEGAPRDSLSLGLGPLFSVMRNQQVTTRAFTSIFVLIDGLKDDRPGDAAAIDAMTGIADVNFNPVADEFGSAQTSGPNADTNGDSLPVYKTVTVDGPAVNVCSSDQFGGVNKLNTIQFVRVTLPTAGRYTFTATATVIPSGETTDPDMWLRRPPLSGIWEVFESEDANSESGLSNNFLPADDYILEVFDFNNRSSSKLLSATTGGPTIGRACFDITVTGP